MMTYWFTLKPPDLWYAELDVNVMYLSVWCVQADELQCQRKLRTEIIQLEDTLAQVRKEYEMSRIELEQTLAANEQTGPINREMRNLISSLQNHNRQLKAELQRFKRKYKESQNEISKLKLMERESPQPPSQVSPQVWVRCFLLLNQKLSHLYILYQREDNCSWLRDCILAYQL